MKNIIILFACIIIILLQSCTVNESTGLIQIINRSEQPIKKLKIGNISLINYLGGGHYYDYWYFSDIKGKIQCEFIKLDPSLENVDLILKPGYWVYIIAEYDLQQGDDYVTVSVYDQNTNQIPMDEWADY